MPSFSWEDVSHEKLVHERFRKDPNVFYRSRFNANTKFFVDSDEIQTWGHHFKKWDVGTPECVLDAEKILGGQLRYFEHEWADIGFPPNWGKNPFTGETVEAEEHWSRLRDFAYGDIKVIWEPNRFGFVFSLARAYARTGDERYAESFWVAIESWREQNPPQLGLNWKCGQEAAFRIMAWCFGLFVFLKSTKTSSSRVNMLVTMISVHADRIEKNIHYALSQQNNHGISEAVGLWTVGILFPEFKKASRWKKIGRKWMIRQVEALIYEDGSFSQHSINYHRVMVHDLLWAVRIGQVNNEPLPSLVIKKSIIAGQWLEAMIVGRNGEAPNYGSNDGALIFSLSNCSYEDFRPVVQAMAHLSSADSLPFPSGAWDEESMWFWGEKALAKPSVKEKIRTNYKATQGGYYRFTSEDSHLFTRCPSKFKHRPSQADLLHVDLWWKGENVAIDPGTYSYNQSSPWDNGLVRTSVHNTVVIDGRDQSKRYSRFLLLPWPKGNVIQSCQSQDGSMDYWEAQHDGFKNRNHAIIHRRGILRLPGDCWIIADGVYPPSCDHWEVNWLFPDKPYTRDGSSHDTEVFEFQMNGGPYRFVCLTSDRKPSIKKFRAQEDSIRGWCSRFYGKKEPALSFQVTPPEVSSLVFSIFGPSDIHASMEEQCVMIQSNRYIAKLHFSSVESSLGAMLKSVKLENLSNGRIEELAPF